MSEIVQQLTRRHAPHEPGTPALKVQDVAVAYRTVGKPFAGSGAAARALQDVTFEARSGEQIAVVGPNGAGKSTLLKVIAGVLKPERGTIAVFGHEPDKHVCIAYVPQRSEIDWSFPVTVTDVVMMGRIKKLGLLGWPRRHDRAIVRKSLERVQGTHLADKQIGELSGGQQQRVFIARALALEADILLLDEPFTGLDIPSQEAILEILSGLRGDDVTVMVATHDLSLAAEQFDRVMLLNKRLLAFGMAEEVFSGDNLLAAYGGHMHVVGDGELILADTCCEH